jgi:hypothetical protein
LLHIDCHVSVHGLMTMMDVRVGTHLEKLLYNWLNRLKTLYLTTATPLMNLTHFWITELSFGFVLPYNRRYLGPYMFVVLPSVWLATTQHKPKRKVRLEFYLFMKKNIFSLWSPADKKYNYNVFSVNKPWTHQLWQEKYHWVDAHLYTSIVQ